MERREYSTTLSELPQHLKRLRVPQRAIVHFWYESPANKAIPKETNPVSDWKTRLRAIAGIWSDFDDVQSVFQDIRTSFNNRIPQ